MENLLFLGVPILKHIRVSLKITSGTKALENINELVQEMSSSQSSSLMKKGETQRALQEHPRKQILGHEILL